MKQTLLLIEEINTLKEKGRDVSKLRISNKAHIVFPYHLGLDKMLEDKLSKRIKEYKKENRHVNEVIVKPGRILHLDGDTHLSNLKT